MSAWACNGREGRAVRARPVDPKRTSVRSTHRREKEKEKEREREREIGARVRVWTQRNSGGRGSDVGTRHPPMRMHNNAPATAALASAWWSGRS